VNEVSLSVNQREIVGLLGPNGAGKTTTFHMIVGLIPPCKGRIFLNGQDVTNLPIHRRARLGLGYLQQEPSIFRGLTVDENILAILESLRLSKRMQQEVLERVLEELNIKHLRGRMAYTLSGGERRRVEIARALSTSPSYLLLDEPFLGVDPIAVLEIQEIVKRLKQQGIGILITDHNVHETLKVTDRAYIMHEGAILISGSAEDLINDEEAKRIYFGKEFTFSMRGERSADHNHWSSP
jgi:lipopolysaccharide export system ATP-binding protein